MLSSCFPLNYLVPRVHKEIWLECLRGTGTPHFCQEEYVKENEI